MESKIPEWFLFFHESLCSVQRRAIRQFKNQKSKKAKRTRQKGMSNMIRALDMLLKAPKPLHTSEILALVKKSPEANYPEPEAPALRPIHGSATSISKAFSRQSLTSLTRSRGPGFSGCYKGGVGGIITYKQAGGVRAHLLNKDSFYPCPKALDQGWAIQYPYRDHAKGFPLRNRGHRNRCIYSKPGLSR